MTTQPSTFPIIFFWIKQYPYNTSEVCHLCAPELRGTRHLAEFRLEQYTDFRDALNQQTSGLIDSEELNRRIWKKAVREQTAGFPQVHHSVLLCNECASFMLSTFLDKQIRLPPPFDQLPAPLPEGQDRLSWVLFKRQTDPDTPLMMFGLDDDITEIIAQGQALLANNTISYDW